MDGLPLLFALAWRNLWRNGRRTAITLAVVSVGLFSVLTMAALMEAWVTSSRDAALNVLIGSAQIHAKGYLDDPTVGRGMAAPTPALVKALDGPGISTWVSRVKLPAVVQSEYRALPIEILGVDPAGEKKISVLPKQIVQGKYLAGTDDTGIVLGRKFADRLKTRLGKRVVLMSQGKDGKMAERAFQVVGIYAGNPEVEDAYAFTGRATLQKMVGIGSGISEISLMVPQDAQLTAVLDGLKEAANGDEVQSWRTLSPLAAAMDTYMTDFIYVWLWVVFVFMAIGIMNTQLMAVFERVREFGLLQALGMRPRMILGQVLLESAMLIGLGVVIGFVAAIAVTQSFAGGVDLGFLAEGAQYFGAGRVLYPRVALGQFVVMSLVIWGLGLIVALWPARRAARSSPVEAMRHVT